MKLWVVLTATLSAVECKVYSTFATQDCENLATHDRIEDAREEAATIRRKWPYIQTFVVELDIKTPDTRENP